MYICIMDHEGKVVYHKNRRCTPEDFLAAIAPFRDRLADLCQAEGIDFILGHAFYMKAIHGVKTKNDRIDSLKIARLIPGGQLSGGLRVSTPDAPHAGSNAAEDSFCP